MNQFTRVPVLQLARAALALLPLASLALAQPPRMAALSDLQPQWGDAGSECPKPDQLGVSFSNLTDPDRDVQTQSGQAALGQNISGGMIETIAALEQQLRELPKDDPSRAQLQQLLEQLRAQQRQTQQITPQALQSAALTLPATLAKLSRALGVVSGPGSVRLMEGAPEFREAGNASRSSLWDCCCGRML